MYDFDQEHEIDNEWKDFLNEFMMPLTNAEDDDEKSDPEYVAAEKVPLDKEELRPVRVSKKELNQLIAELLEDSSLNFDSEPSTSYKRSNAEGQVNKLKRHRVTSPLHPKPQSPKISSRMYSPQELLATPTRYGAAPSTSAASTTKEEQLGVSSPSSPFFLSQLTPQRSSQLSANYTPSPMHGSSDGLNTPQITGVYGSSQPPPILMINAQNQLEIRSSSNLISQAFLSNGIVQLPQYQSIVVQVPTIDLLQNQLNLSATIGQPQETISAPLSPASPKESSNLTDDAKKQIYRKPKLNAFEHLATEEPPEDKFPDKTMKGFTFEQKQIYEQQMRKHAQLLSQNFLQVYASPQWWEKADPIKKNLKELSDVVNSAISPHTSQHIENCLGMCNEWESSLQENSDRNRKYAEFLYEECELDERALKMKQPFKGRFSNRLMEHMLSSKAIVYPNLLPAIPFRAVTFHKIEPPNSEISLLATGLERFYYEQYEKLNKFNPYRIREPRLATLAKCIVREYHSFRNDNSLIKLLEGYKVNRKINPIKYFFIHKKAPSVKHLIEDINWDKLVSPKQLRRGLLPKKWDNYMFSYDRVSFRIT